jgi:CubicO group peptidase (beta-lactamase class C family)
VALAALAADVLGTPFGQCLPEWVLDPLGLTEAARPQLLLPGSRPPSAS